MDDLKLIIAANIADLRKEYSLTQIDLAEKLNYSDKAVSKWERGESIPDVVVLKQVADLFHVSLDYLVTKHEKMPSAKVSVKASLFLRNHVSITEMSILLVWFLALLSFIVIGFFCGFAKVWIVFVYALPVSSVVWLVLNSIWFNRRRNFWIISLLMWSALLSLYLSFVLFAEQSIWLLFTLGVPGQIVIFLWSKIRKPKKIA